MLLVARRKLLIQLQDTWLHYPERGVHRVRPVRLDILLGRLPGIEIHAVVVPSHVVLLLVILRLPPNCKLGAREFVYVPILPIIVLIEHHYYYLIEGH
jgi:hypothetical protein